MTEKKEASNFSWPHRSALSNLNLAKVKFNYILALGGVPPSSGHWASSLYMVLKSKFDE